MADVPIEVTVTVAAITATVGFFGVVVGGIIARWNDTRKLRLEFAGQQLREFYSPLLATRTHILALGKLRELIFEKGNDAWGTLVDEARERGGPTEISKMREKRWPEFQVIVEDVNERHRVVVMPFYDQMLTTFREKYWLAEPSTREHFGLLLEFVEGWHRHLDKKIPPEVAVLLDIREEKLHPFYANLQTEFDRRQKMVASASSMVRVKQFWEGPAPS